MEWQERLLPGKKCNWQKIPPINTDHRKPVQQAGSAGRAHAACRKADHFGIA
jgi:hypothetical protein